MFLSLQFGRALLEYETDVLNGLSWAGNTGTKDLLVNYKLLKKQIKKVAAARKVSKRAMNDALHELTSLMLGQTEKVRFWVCGVWWMVDGVSHFSLAASPPTSPAAG